MTKLPILLRSIEVDTGRRFTLAAAGLFLIGFLPMALGSLATFLFFALAGVSLLDILRRRVRFRIPAPAGYAVFACLTYFAVDALAPILYDNRADSWIPVVASLQFLLLPIVLAGFLPARLDPIRTFVSGVRLSAIIGAVIAVIQLIDGADRATGGMINSLPFGTIAALFAVISVIGAGEDGWLGRIVAVAAFAAGLGASFLSEARGAWLALPVLLVILVVYLRARYGGRVAIVVGAILAAIAATVIVAAGESIRERFDETFAAFEGFTFGEAEQETPEYSLDQRALLLAYGIEAIAERPVLGYGPHNAVGEVRARAAVDGYAIDNFGHLHNEMLTETVGNGIVGLMTLLLLLAAPIVTALRSARDARFVDRMALASLASAGAFLFGLTSLAFGHDITNTIYAAILLVVCLSAAQSNDAAHGATAASDQGRPDR